MMTITHVTTSVVRPPDGTRRGIEVRVNERGTFSLALTRADEAHRKVPYVYLSDQDKAQLILALGGSL